MATNPDIDALVFIGMGGAPCRAGRTHVVRGADTSKLRPATLGSPAPDRLVG